MYKDTYIGKKGNISKGSHLIKPGRKKSYALESSDLKHNNKYLWQYNTSDHILEAII